MQKSQFILYRILFSDTFLSYIKDALADPKESIHKMSKNRNRHIYPRIQAYRNLIKVSKRLRHRKLTTTMTYLIITKADIRKELKDMSDPLEDIL